MAENKKLTISKILSYPTNIVGLLSQDRLNSLYDFCSTRYDDLKSQRAARNEKLEEANKAALQVFEPKTFPWEGCSSVKYPLITNSSIDYASRIFPAVWQNGDVVKTRYYNEHKDYEAGERLAVFGNYLLNEKVPGWAQSLDKLCAAYPVDGLVLKKVYYDPEVGTPRSELVYPQDFFIPNEAYSIDSAEYYFHRMRRAKRTMIGNLRSGLWANFKEDELDDESGDAVATEGPEARPEDKVPSSMSSLYEVVEAYCFCDMDGDGYAEPYIVTFVPRIQKVVRIVPRFDLENIYSNEDGKIYKISTQEFFVPYEFLQSPDGSIYALGLGELLLPINKAINSGIDQLMDAGTLNNMSSGWISKNVRLKQGESPFTPGEWKAVDSYGGKLSENIVPMPKSEPSATTFQLVSTLIDAGAQIAGASQIKDIQIPSNLSQIASMAIIENGMTGLKSVYERFHRSLSLEIRLILTWWMKNPDFDEYKSIAGPDASPDDFKLIGSLVPVSNPSLVTTISRATKAQQLLDILKETGVTDGAKTIQKVLDLLGLNPADVMKSELSPAEQMAIEKEKATLDNMKADTVFKLSQSLRAKDQGIGDLVRANSETIARVSKSMLDLKNASLRKVSQKKGDASVSTEVTDTSMFMDELLALAKAAGVAFETPIGKVLGEKLEQSVEEGVQGVSDTEPNDIRVRIKEQSNKNGLAIPPAE